MGEVIWFISDKYNFYKVDSFLTRKARKPLYLQATCRIHPKLKKSSKNYKAFVR